MREEREPFVLKLLKLPLLIVKFALKLVGVIFLFPIYIYLVIIEVKLLY